MIVIALTRPELTDLSHHWHGVHLAEFPTQKASTDRAADHEVRTAVQLNEVVDTVLIFVGA